MPDPPGMPVAFSWGLHQEIHLSVGELFQALSAMAAERFPGPSGVTNNNWSFRKEAVRRLLDAVDGTATSSAAGIAELAKYGVTTASLRTRLSSAWVNEF